MVGSWHTVAWAALYLDHPIAAPRALFRRSTRAWQGSEVDGRITRRDEGAKCPSGEGLGRAQRQSAPRSLRITHTTTPIGIFYDKGPDEDALKHATTALIFVLTTWIALLLLGNTGHDDSHITYWAADSLCRHGLPLNYNGDRIEQSSTLLFTVLLSIPACLTPLSTPTLGVALSALGRWAILVLLVSLARRDRTLVAIAAAVAPLAAYWSLSGMETTLAAALFLALPITLARFPDRPLPYLLSASLLVLVRPEGILVWACVFLIWLLHTLFTSPKPPRSIAIGLVPAGVSLGFSLMRRAIYGVWWPQPVLSKSHGIEPERGMEYLQSYQDLLWLPLALAALFTLFAWWDPKKRRLLWLLLALGAAQLGFVVLSGGDWMGVGRFLVSLETVAIALIILGSNQVERPWSVLALLLLCGHSLSSLQTIALKTGTGRPLVDAQALRDAAPEPYPLLEYANIAHYRDIQLLRAIEQALPTIRARIDGPITVLSGQAGMVPYYLFHRHHDLRFLDTNNLATNDGMRCLPQKSLRHWPIGTHFSPRALDAHPDARARCGIEMPHLIYDAGPRASKVLKNLPYRVVFTQRTVRRPKTLFGNHASAGGWVAVRNDLID